MEARRHGKVLNFGSMYYGAPPDLQHQDKGGPLAEAELLFARAYLDLRPRPIAPEKAAECMVSLASFLADAPFAKKLP